MTFELLLILARAASALHCESGGFGGCNPPSLYNYDYDNYE